MGFLTGKTAIITGAGRAVLSDGSCGSIGYGIATAFAKEGANLVITGRNVKKLEEAKNELEAKYGIRVLPVQADVCAGTDNEATVQNVVNQAVDTFGGIQVLVNNAQASASGVPLAEHTTEQFDLALYSGLYAAFYYMKACYPYLAKSKGSVITDVFYDDSLLATKYESWNVNWTNKDKSDFIAKEGDMNYFLNGKEVKADDIKAALAVKGSEKALYDIDADGDIDTVIVINPTVDYMEADYVVKGDEVKIQGVKYDKDEVSGYEDLVKGDVFTFVDMADAVRYYEELAPINGQKTKYTIPTKDSAAPYITFADKDYELSLIHI